MPELLADTARLRMAALLPPPAREAYLRSTAGHRDLRTLSEVAAAEHIAPVLAAQVDLALVRRLAAMRVEEQVEAMEDPNIIAGLLGMPAFGRGLAPSKAPTSAGSTSPDGALGVEDLRIGLEGMLGRKVISNVGAEAQSRSSPPTTSTLPPPSRPQSTRSPPPTTPFTFLNDPALTHLTDAVLAHLDRPSHLALRLVSKHLCERADDALLAALVITADGFTTPRGLPPRSDFIHDAHLRAAPRTLTIHSVPPNPLALRLDLLTAVQRVRCTQAGLPALWTVRAPTAIIKGLVAPLTPQEWITAPTLRLPTLTHPTTVVYEIQYASTSLLLRAHPLWALPDSLRRLAVVLSPYEGELGPLPELLLYTSTEDSVLAEVVDDDAELELEDGQELVHFDPPERRVFDCFPGPCPDPVGFFDKLATIFGHFASPDLELVVVGTEGLGPAYYTHPVESFDVKERFREVMGAAIAERGLSGKGVKKLLKRLSFVPAEEWEGW
jgi:hypothetical protein